MLRHPQPGSAAERRPLMLTPRSQADNPSWCVRVWNRACVEQSSVGSLGARPATQVLTQRVGVKLPIPLCPVLQCCRVGGQHLRLLWRHVGVRCADVCCGRRGPHAGRSWRDELSRQRAVGAAGSAHAARERDNGVGWGRGQRH
eukprot:349667-Chlamydomonas_euryale.AAC.7